ncbi:beta-glucan synthesis-associated [Metschnikowia bicuspidata]|uniref:Beta-glucan synthesis-associated n=1 Tax=Metschnikowia bicuspidata TaxID=27322 RepID=A0A4P9ZHK6_9ASCO|nr:beta-glucan synthesis-associated [Metschnikowia bicuspidata]
MEGDYLANDYFLPNVASQNDEIHMPPKYNRYPSIASSRVASSNTLNSHFFNGYPPQHRREDLNGLSHILSKKSSSPFMSMVYYSPFGGYPASSFPLHIDEKEDDDYLHNPDPIADAEYDRNRFMHDLKSMDRNSMLGLVGLGFFFLFLTGIGLILPILTYSGITDHPKPLSYEVLTQYNYPIAAAIRTSLIDPETPPEARWKMNHRGENWTLTFSDEFNAEGRTFYEGDDQFFQAVDLHYDATEDLEWYDPDAVTTVNGTLLFRMDAIKNHDLFYRSAMVQSWNKLCFTQGLIVVSANLPNYGNISGLWPGIWTMGNLARPGYLATTEGVWPYSYDSCDAGITANQSSPDGISYLPGQKLNLCTCNGEDHPNRGTGRGAPEIDILEGSVDTNIRDGVVSQSLQVAPFDIWYMPDYNFVEIYDFKVTAMNSYVGGPFQQAISGVSTLNTTWYEYGDNAGRYQSYGFEYLNNNDNGYITWYVGQEPTFTMHAYALGPNGNVGFRRVSKEPMTIIMNLGMSKTWAYIDWSSINFPCHMRVSYVRIYQSPKAISMTCDPSDYPTSKYINDHLNAYQNPNLTSWSMAGYKFPRNRLVHKC